MVPAESRFEKLTVSRNSRLKKQKTKEVEKMAVEKSVFINNDQINSFLSQNYGFENNEIFRINEGSANCYKIINKHGEFFLKEFQKKFDRQTLKREIEICKIVQDIGVTTSEFVAAKNDDYILEHKGHCFHLQKYIDGYMFERNNFNDPLLFESAEILGKIHLGLSGVDFLPNGFPEEWFEGWSKEKSIKKHELIIENIINSQRDRTEKIKILEACETKIRLLKKYNDDHLKYSKLKRVNSHGDYNNLQILCDQSKEKIIAIIDFSSAAYVPAVWEIIRSYSYSAKECIDGSNINFQKFKKFIDKYLNNSILDLFDVANMAGFYYYNLLRSTYGLTSENKKLVEFAFWRTKLCEYLSTNYQDIDSFLESVYKGVL